MKDPRLSSCQLIINEEPFAEFLWMEHEEEFNQQVEEQLREEDFIERCFEELWEEEEERESFIPSRDLPHLQGIQSDVHKDADYPIYSRLNPNAKEFTPGIQRHVM
ncbi:hypothetical protein CesoFtcFv8_009640 [Champsocephalus esox]|uniref:Polyadenylate-binding protein-interacting protein 2 n=1 Tax=Champsocephalus esox TaxID=159716 RepID=A0AAN8C5V2_9TELE|nr:hypothetical protein CesoFtcFv8_009640 [Champsocephalus esox]